ncbi:MAG: 2'-5' RNA ligase family protein [Gorillibacterium sp.]|nr:2'-5' RNA ligase family protein [Gorillibacterium sp.]
MFALELFFDDRLNNYVRRVWKSLHERKIALAMYDIADIRPHITVAIYSTIDKWAAFDDLLTDFMENQKKLDLQFDSLASFPTSGTLFLAPTITRDLFAMHEDYYARLDSFSTQASSLYTPNHWNPHCSLAIKLTKEALGRAWRDCLRDFQPITTRIESIGLVELSFADGKCISSPTIKEFDFL